MRRLLFLLIFGLTGLAVLIALGTWQVRRLEWKEAILADIRTRIAADPVDLPVTLDRADDKYLPVTVDGILLPGELHLLVSVKRVGPGFRIISPMVLPDGRRILIDRGFVPSQAKTDPRRTGPATIVGNLHWPQESDGYTPAPDLAANTWFARDVDAMAAALGTEPVLVVAKSQSDPGVTPLPVDTAGIPNDHLNYAITWFSLAAIWAAMTGYFLWRTRAKAQG